jgi:hypothetical protein
MHQTEKCTHFSDKSDAQTRKLERSSAFSGASGAQIARSASPGRRSRIGHAAWIGGIACVYGKLLRRTLHFLGAVADFCPPRPRYTFVIAHRFQ